MTEHKALTNGSSEFLPPGYQMHPPAERLLQHHTKEYGDTLRRLTAIECMKRTATVVSEENVATALASLAATERRSNLLLVIVEVVGLLLCAFGINAISDSATDNDKMGYLIVACGFVLYVAQRAVGLRSWSIQAWWIKRKHRKVMNQAPKIP